MRQFESGATRDTNEGKIDFEGFLSPIVLRRYGEYMNKHRVQADGNIRTSGNWQKHFGENHYDVCIKSAWRHFVDWWSEHRGLGSQDGLEEAVCALMFNAMAYLDKLLKDKRKGATDAQED